jgi:hypothetical protein
LVRPLFAVTKVLTKFVRPRWTFEKSIFKDWKADTEATLTKCFEADWKAAKFSAFIKNEEDRAATKAYARKFYK